MKNRILIVEDDVTFALMLSTWLSRKGFEVETVAGVGAARRALAAGEWAVVVTDMRLPDGDGLGLLEWLSAREAAPPAIVMTGYAEIRNAVLCMKLGAKDYVSKPVRPEELLEKIMEAIASPQVAPSEVATATPPLGPDYLEGQSEAARRLYEYVRLVAPTEMGVLIVGESGTGKEHLARLVHEGSRRAQRPFVAIDCGALPRELASSELFGHVKGAFTGAATDKTGAFVAADGGTLFLDEVGNLPYDVQVHLLRALQERRIRPVGATAEVPVDLRIVAATNEDLAAAVATGRFRGDLYHRLNEFTLRVPPLRERRDDVPLFADFFLDEANHRLGRSIVGFDDESRALLEAYDWPGNLRQMKNAIMGATLLARGAYVTARELPPELVPPVGTAAVPLHDATDEEARIRRALAAARGNKSQAARLLGIDRKTLYERLRRYGIE